MDPTGMSSCYLYALPRTEGAWRYHAAGVLLPLRESYIRHVAKQVYEW